MSVQRSKLPTRSSMSAPRVLRTVTLTPADFPWSPDRQTGRLELQSRAPRLQGTHRSSGDFARQVGRYDIVAKSDAQPRLRR
jgi:hypothetical protein